jgi:hypothetical protein
MLLETAVPMEFQTENSRDATKVSSCITQDLRINGHGDYQQRQVSIFTWR